MNFLKLRFPIRTIRSWRRLISSCLLMLSFLFLLGMPPALAGLNDDRFEGNIFVLYGGNPGLVPPKVKLAESLLRDRATLLVFYVDDSRDCKKFAPMVSQLQAFYGRVTDFIPINVDTIPYKSTYTKAEPGYYYEGAVPQVLVFNKSGEVVLNKKGQVPFEELDDTFREVFNLLPRSESLELKRRDVNEFNTELAK